MNTTEPKTVLEQFTVIKRGISYRRVSTDEQADKGFSLPTQLKEIQAYAAKNGIELVKDFYDDFSGSYLNERPGLTEARQWLRTGRADCIICLDSDRLTREPGYYFYLRDEFNSQGIELHYSKRGQVNLNDFGQMLVEDFYGRFAHEWKRKLVEATTRGRRGKVEAGNIIIQGRAAYGYRLEQVGGKTKLVPFEPEARIVRLIFNLYVNLDYSLQKITDHLSELQVPTFADTQSGISKKIGRGVWSRATILKILSNTTYKGVWTYAKKSDTPLSIEVESIVNQAIWQAAQVRLAENRTNRRRDPDHEYLLNRRATCDCCNSTMVCNASSYKNTLYYRCLVTLRPKRFNPKSCNSKAFRVDRVDYEVWQWVKGLLLDPKKLEDGLRRYQERAASEAGPIRAELARLVKSIEKLKARLERARNLYLEGEEEKAVYLAEKRNIDSDIAQLESDRQGLQDKLDSVSLSSDAEAEIHELAALVREGLELLEDEPDSTLKRRIINRLNVRVRLAVEDGLKIAHATCVLDSKVLTLLTTGLLNDCQHHKIIFSARLIVGRVKGS